MSTRLTHEGFAYWALQLIYDDIRRAEDLKKRSGTYSGCNCLKDMLIRTGFTTMYMLVASAFKSLSKDQFTEVKKNLANPKNENIAHATVEIMLRSYGQKWTPNSAEKVHLAQITLAWLAICDYKDDITIKFSEDAFADHMVASWDESVNHK